MFYSEYVYLDYENQEIFLGLDFWMRDCIVVAVLKKNDRKYIFLSQTSIHIYASATTLKVNGHRIFNSRTNWSGGNFVYSS